MKICIFPGTFNPIHNSHLKVANYVLEHFGLEKIIFIPAYMPPHKNYDLAMSDHRFNMVKLSIESNPKFEISDIEFVRQGKSYTYLTVCELYKKYNTDEKINLIIGTDAFRHIESWYETDKLKQITDFIVFKREFGNDFNLDYLKDKGYNFTIADMDFVDISSTRLRQLISENKDINRYVPMKVERYIKENGLYKN